MEKTVCGVDCSTCDFKEGCSGCNNKKCILKECCSSKNKNNCNKCVTNCQLKQDYIDKINKLGLNCPSIDQLYALLGTFINLEYHLVNGNTIKLLDDNRVYLGTQVKENNSDKCYGIVVDNDYILVSRYQENGINPEIILYQKTKY